MPPLKYDFTSNLFKHMFLYRKTKDFYTKGITKLLQSITKENFVTGMKFTKRARRVGNSIMITVPIELVDSYEIKQGDKIEMDIIKIIKDKVKA